MTSPLHFRLNQDKSVRGIGREGIAEISVDLRRLLAGVFAFYLKTKHFNWHMMGRHFRDYRLLLDEQADQLFGMTRLGREPVRLVGTTLRPFFVRLQKSVARTRSQKEKNQADL